MKTPLSFPKTIAVSLLKRKLFNELHASSQPGDGLDGSGEEIGERDG